MAPADPRCDLIYAIERWGEGYFEIGPSGHLCARPHPGSETRINLVQLADKLRDAGLALPVLVRFDDILRHRAHRLQGAFAAAIATHDYQGRYRPVYPIKVNQQRSVVRALLSAGGLGLEAGSKPELMAVLALVPPGQPVICNGYKDREYIRLALIGRRLGLDVHIVIEKPSELDLVLDEAKRLGVEPAIGVRIRLAAAAAGNWQNSGGDKAKFGLSASQLLVLVERLRAADKLHWLQLLHAHLGSQIPSLDDIRAGVAELGQFYAALHALGAQPRILDLGGGLGVDYEGSHTRAYCSMNYRAEDYAEAIVATIGSLCAERSLPEPDLITESGRALTAHHAVLITDVADRERATDAMADETDQANSALAESKPLPAQAVAISRNVTSSGTVATSRTAATIGTHVHQAASRLQAAPEPPEVELARLEQALRDATEAPALAVYEEAEAAVQALRRRFATGQLGQRGLIARARGDELFIACCRALRPRLSHANRRQREVLEQIDAQLADKLFCNFSLFQSLPDVWAIDQIFPICPLQRLDEAPTERGVVHDLTCDSDGCIAHYVDQDGIEASLPVHAFDPQRETYLLGFFLVGAYQEILGDMHNLFGDTDAVAIELDADQPEGWRLLELEHGDSADELLATVHFEPRALLAQYRRRLDDAALDRETREQLYSELKAGLYGYTYLGRL
ncbi:biosynthetic arginine decarboxylase [Lamprobacter modestohalophilus]|uniref:biosynthetic arginine decarboxylase n=1 Tax=Lamprobacter modestohalophilus TaxID=1064514 RepID=UPI002ADEAEEB|nr:biosynthetic arginine decarboxylase [Lamprobacter modestohalophilus]MEA1049273.1 biosynthetic arginine decarboxylase [Lamprobacter modestohalophilus]